MTIQNYNMNYHYNELPKNIDNCLTHLCFLSLVIKPDFDYKNTQ